MPDVFDGEDGQSTVTAVFSVAAFLLFLLLAAQVMLVLFTASVVQAAAVDGASHGAGAGQSSSIRAAERRAEEVLGGLAPRAEVTASISRDAAGQVLTVRIDLDRPSLVPGVRPSFARVVRQATARVER